TRTAYGPALPAKNVSGLPTCARDRAAAPTIISARPARVLGPWALVLGPSQVPGPSEVLGPDPGRRRDRGPRTDPGPRTDQGPTTNQTPGTKAQGPTRLTSARAPSSCPTRGRSAPRRSRSRAQSAGRRRDCRAGPADTTAPGTADRPRSPCDG